MYNRQYNYKQSTHTRKKRTVKKSRRIIMMLALLCIVTTSVIFFGKQAISHTINPDIIIQSLHTAVSSSHTSHTTSEVGIIGQLNQMAKNNSKVAGIIANIDKYPDELLELLVKNPETVDFVLHYPDKKDSMEAVHLTDAETKGKIPLFLQWDERWGYAGYGNDLIATAGCGPTCLSMVIVGITGDISANPGEVADFSENNGYCVPDVGTDWGLLTAGAQAYGLVSNELPLDESIIIREIHAGHPVICCMGEGDFTTTGHFIVIYGYDGGYFLIHDPNSIKRSNKKWAYETIKDQIQNLWAYSK